jgi:hypothetical protein
LFSILVGVVVLAIVALFAVAPAFAAPKPPKPKMDTPVIACGPPDDNTETLSVCAGLTGAPAGFSVQWITCAALADGPDGIPGNTDDGTWPLSDSEFLCKASFSGNANGSNWDLGASDCASVVIGGLNDTDPGVSFNCNDPLACQTCYVYRAFAHADSTLRRSDFTTNLECTTADCELPHVKDGDFCTRSQGFFGSGNASRDAMIACFGGDPTGVACTSTAGTSLVTIGGGTYTYTWTTTGTCVDVQPGGGIFLMDSGLANLRKALGGGGDSSYFTANGTNAITMGTGGGLASQTAALTLNVGTCGTSLCGPNGGASGGGAAYAAVKLCNFAAGDAFKIDDTPISQATADALNGQTVADVLAAANAYLGGNGAALPYGLGNAADLNELVANLNLAFDLKDWDGDGIEDCACGGMTAFAEDHICLP